MDPLLPLVHFYIMTKSLGFRPPQHISHRHTKATQSQRLHRPAPPKQEQTKQQSNAMAHRNPTKKAISAISISSRSIMSASYGRRRPWWPHKLPLPRRFPGPFHESAVLLVVVVCSKVCSENDDVCAAIAAAPLKSIVIVIAHSRKSRVVDQLCFIILTILVEVLYLFFVVLARYQSVVFLHNFMDRRNELTNSTYIYIW